MSWNWRTTLGVVLLLAAVLSAWSAWRQRARPAAQVAEDARSEYVLHDFEMIALDADTGRESLALRAPQMRRSRADQTSEIDTPLFLLPDGSGQPWTLRAETGWIDAKGEELRLRGDVEGDSPAVPGAVPTTFRTQRLDVFPRQNLARTAEPVSMTRPGIVQNGVGFEADLKTRQYKLLSKVRTRYEPNVAR